jgi:arabinogalactan endo-1,4-beta-galactosidase
MKFRYIIIAIAMALFTFSTCSDDDNTPSTGTEDPVYDMTGFAKGADVSWLTEMEKAGYKYYNTNGRETECMTLLRDLGINSIRLRVWVNPENGWCNKNDLLVKAWRAHNLGMRIMIDFHYSDTWADPGKQTKPAAWRSIAADSLPGQLYTYTKDALSQFKTAGVSIDSIQIGNEITNGMLWNDGRVSISSGEYNSNTQWTRFLAMLTQCSKACREVFPSAQIIVHTEKSGNVDGTRGYYNRLKAIDYDVIGLSYYPFWHGTLNMLESVLTMLSTDFPTKSVIIAEVAYCYNQAGMPSDTKYRLSWPATEAGQAQFTKDFVNSIKKFSQVKGAFWWFPEETYSPNRRISGDLHRGLFSNRNGKVLAALEEYVLLK